MEKITTTPKQLTALLKHFGASDIREKTNNILDFLAGYEHGHDHGHAHDHAHAHGDDHVHDHEHHHA